MTAAVLEALPTPPAPIQMVTEGDILALCSPGYTGIVLYCGLLPGVGCHGGPLAAVRLLNLPGQPTISVDAARLVARECCMNGWGTA